jgi:hypothetical protein
MRVTKRFLVVAFLLATVITNMLLTIVPRRELYLSKNFWQEYPNYKKVYENSQYVSKKPTAWIPDETINTFAGASYVRGVSPILIAADTPPLGRYLIGLSALLFNNVNIITLFFGVLSLVLMYLIGRQIYSNAVVALIPPALLSFEPLFKNQFVYTPLLDIMQLAFLLLSFYFFNKGLVSEKKILLFFTLANIFLGCFIATKFFITGIIIAAAWFSVVLLHRDKKRFLYLSATLPIAIFVLLSTYVKTLFDGYSIEKFLGIQKWVYLYHKSQLILPLSIWPLLFLNQWYVWWGDDPIISDNQWQITWPLITTISLITVVIYVLRLLPHKKEVEVLLAWTVFYLAFFSIGQISSRYLVILFPVMYLVSVYGVEKLAVRYMKPERKITKRKV